MTPLRYCFFILILASSACSYLPVFEQATDRKPKAATKIAAATPKAAVKVLPKKTRPGTIDTTEHRRGKVIFLRSQVAASAVPVALYQIDGGHPRFIAEAHNNTQVHHRVAPGAYTFMLVAEDSIDYLQVDVMADKRYYAVVDARMGMWKPSFSLTPVKKPAKAAAQPGSDNYYFGDEKVEELLSTPIPSVDANINSETAPEELVRRHRRAWSRWLVSDAQVLKQKRLASGDGR